MKALGNGYAISAVLGKENIMQSACETFISSTFWTEAIGPSAALATLKEMQKIKSWEILPSLGKKIKDIWFRYSKKYNVPITINGIDALPTFNFNTYEATGFKTIFTQFMLKEGFLASTLFYPTTSHKIEHINQYSVAFEKVLKKYPDLSK